jgi:orotate phosphoribosyltransferase
VDDSALLAGLRQQAYLEGDFVLRSGKRSSYYLDKYRFETLPDLLEALGERIAAKAQEVEDEMARLAAPQVGAIALAAAASLASRVPFLIVRDKPKEYGTANRLEGAYDEGDCVVLVEDVVTTGGAACDAVRAVRDAGLRCRTAVCVIDRQEGGVDALARLGVRLYPLFRARDVAEAGKSAAKPHG